MRKLLITTAAILALAGPGAAHAGDAYTACENSKGAFDAADCGLDAVRQWWTQRDGEKIVEIYKNAWGTVVAYLGEKGNLLVRNVIPKKGTPKAYLRLATPPGQLAACDSAEVLLTLAHITNKSVDWIVYPEKLGGNENKNFCSVYLSAYITGWQKEHRTNYTVEWMDRSKGTFWVQIQ
jgi:hypothetical protein